MSRTPISKKMRFEVFKRDNFTCRYCGRKPPEVVLHCDHIAPWIKVKIHDKANLATACRDCNIGKGATELNEKMQIEVSLSHVGWLFVRVWNNKHEERPDNIRMMIGFPYQMAGEMVEKIISGAAEMKQQADEGYCFGDYYEDGDPLEGVDG